MLVGYARTSTLEQVAGLEAQLRDLKAAGCEKVFQEHVSATAQRIEFERCLEFVRQGDTLVVTKLDRLARSVVHLLEIVTRLQAKNVELQILTGGEAMDTRTATGRLMLTVLGAIGEFERAMMLERQREGIAAAKAVGKYKGRVPTAGKQSDEIRRLADSGMTRAAIAQLLRVSERSVYRVLAAGSA